MQTLHSLVEYASCSGWKQPDSGSVIISQNKPQKLVTKSYRISSQDVITRNCPIQSLPLNHFSHLTSSSSRSTTSFIPELFYKVRSARSNNNWKQSRHISCSRQSYFQSITVTWPCANLSPVPPPHPRHVSPVECWVMSDGKGHPGIRLQAMLGRKERCVMWLCVRELVYIYILGI